MQMLMYIGSYTPDTGGKGAGVSVWDSRLEPAAPTLALSGPSWLVAHPVAPVLYAVSELADGAVNALAVSADGALTRVSHQPSGGSDPCHLAVTPDGRHLLCANYGSGSVAVFGINDDGTLGARTDLVTHHGSGPDPSRQEGPHTHQVSVQTTNEVTAVDLGTDTLYGYRLGADGRLAPTWQTHAGPGIGPRHLISAPDGRRYVADELASTVSVYEPEPGGGLRLVHRRPATLTEPAGGNQPSEIALSADSRYLYVGNRGNDTVTTFAVDGDELRGVDETPTGGQWPRHFAFNGDLMYVANQNSHTVTVLRVDPETGVPRQTGVRIEVPSPVCVLIRRA